MLYNRKSQVNGQEKPIQLRVYSAAKTVADCFKYRNKIGLDVALEALREAWYQRLFTMDKEQLRIFLSQFHPERSSND